MEVTGIGIGIGIGIGFKSWYRYRYQPKIWYRCIPIMESNMLTCPVSRVISYYLFDS